MKTTLKTILCPILLTLTAFAQVTYVQGGNAPATDSEQALKFEYLTVE